MAATTTKSKLTPTTLATVKNGYQGVLVYKAQKNGERFVWKEFGDEQEMELGELKAAKSAHKAYFENNWFILEAPEVVEYLGVGQFYKNALSAADLDALLTKEPEEIIGAVNRLSAGQKKTLTARAQSLFAEGKIDSNKAIAALETALGLTLTERQIE
jgi:hypothetical protein